MTQKYISHERMTIQQIQSELEREYQRWNYIAANGCQDPFSPQGGCDGSPQRGRDIRKAAKPPTAIQ